MALPPHTCTCSSSYSSRVPAGGVRSSLGRPVQVEHASSWGAQGLHARQQAAPHGLPAADGHLQLQLACASRHVADRQQPQALSGHSICMRTGEVCGSCQGHPPGCVTAEAAGTAVGAPEAVAAHRPCHTEGTATMCVQPAAASQEASLAGCSSRCCGGTRRQAPAIRLQVIRSSRPADRRRAWQSCSCACPSLRCPRRSGPA